MGTMNREAAHQGGPQFQRPGNSHTGMTSSTVTPSAANSESSAMAASSKPAVRYAIESAT